ncbi:MAG: aminotransferase class I/II-fold pyridoxal phosphate-dependent enzyme [Desulfobacterales bacterium]
MSLDLLDGALARELSALAAEGRAKPPERVITGYLPAEGDRGPRFRLQGTDRLFLRMNANDYLSLSHHPELLRAAEEASRALGVGPGAVRFIDGTFSPHVALEEAIARFVGKPAARIFSSAYAANLGLALAITQARTFWIGDALNHNSIIRAQRIAGVPPGRKAVFAHNDLDDLARRLGAVPAEIERVVVVFDGVFSMRGDHAPLSGIVEVLAPHRERFPQGLVTVMDDSHGIGAFGPSGRGTAEVCGAAADIVVGTFGKAFGANGGFVAASRTVVEALRQRADTTIYSNPPGVGDCAAALRALALCDRPEGRRRLGRLQELAGRLRSGVAALGWRTLPGRHPIVPLVTGETPRTHLLVEHLFRRDILATGLTFPVVPRGEETVRFQVNADHTPEDIDRVLAALADFRC